MDLIYIRNNDGHYDSGYLKNFEADFDISSDPENMTNDFAIKMPLPETMEGLYFAEGLISSMVFVEGTEYGGEISGSEIDLEENIITYTGRTWRGTLDQWIIEPPIGQDYRVVSGNLAEILRALPMHPLMTIADTTYSSSAFQFDRYITVFNGATKLLTNTDPSLRLAFSFEQTAGQYTGTITATITPTRNLASLVEISQDYDDKVRLKITRDGNTPKHLICLGQGELKDREVIHLYADDEWNVSTTPITGAYPVETYDYSGSESLLTDSMKHYAELISNHEQIDVSISDLKVRLGDIVSARDHLTGENAQAEITKIVYHCTDYGEYQTESYEYMTKVKKKKTTSSTTTIIDGGGSGDDMDSLSNMEIEELLQL